MHFSSEWDCVCFLSLFLNKVKVEHGDSTDCFLVTHSYFKTALHKAGIHSRPRFLKQLWEDSQNISLIAVWPHYPLIPLEGQIRVKKSW